MKERSWPPAKPRRRFRCTATGWSLSGSGSRARSWFSSGCLSGHRSPSYASSFDSILCHARVSMCVGGNVCGFDLCAVALWLVDRVSLGIFVLFPTVYDTDYSFADSGVACDIQEGGR